eukprot:gene339-73_t
MTSEQSGDVSRAKARVLAAEATLRQYADAIIVLLTLPFYASWFFHDQFIDEGFAVTRNVDVTDTTKSTWYDILVHDFWGQDLWPSDGIHWTHKSFRPLITYSFRAVYVFFSDERLHMPVLRLTNCLCHTLTCLAVRRNTLFRKNVFAAFLFAVQPVDVENIVYLVGRADSLATLFFVWGSDREQSFWQVAVCTVVSGLCKETGFTLPVLVAFLCLVKGKWRRALAYLGFFVVVFVGRSWYVGGTDVGFGYVDTPVRYQEGVLVRFFSYLMHHLVYAQLLVLPWNLSWDYSYDSIPLCFELWRDMRVLGIVAAYLFVILLFFRAPVAAKQRQMLLGPGRYSGRQDVVGAAAHSADAAHAADGGSDSAGGLGGGSCQGISAGEQGVLAGLVEDDEQALVGQKNEEIVTDYFAAAMIVIPFVPASNLFFLVGTTVGERLLYPVTVGSCLVLDRLVQSAVSPASSGSKNGREKSVGTSSGKRLRSLVKYVKLVYLAYFMAVSYVRTSHWRSKDVLFEVDAKASAWQPRSAKVLHQYAVFLQTQGKLDDALSYYQQALNVFDDNAMSDYCVARIYLEKNDCTKALQVFFKINDGHGIGFGDHNQFLLNNDFGYALTCVQAYQDAIPILEEALQLMNPNFPYIYNALAMSYYFSSQ